MQLPNYISTAQLCAKHPIFKIGGLKKLLAEQHTNGLHESGAIVRIGRKLLIDEELFFAWVKQQGGVS